MPMKIKHLLLILFTSVTTLVFAIPPRPVPARYVVDLANIFTDKQETGLETELQLFADSTDNEIVVLTVLDLEDQAPAVFAQQVGDAWGIGQDKISNGVLILIKPRTQDSRGEVFIATGYGNEGVLTDAKCSRIIGEYMIDYLKDGDYFSAAEAGARECVRLLGGEYREMQESNSSIHHDSDEEESLLDLVLSLLFLIGVIVLIFYLLYLYQNNPTRVALRKIENSMTVEERDQAVAEAKERNISTEKIDKAVAEIPTRLTNYLKNNSTDWKDFNRIAAAGPALGLTEAAIQEIRNNMPKHLLSAIETCQTHAGLTATKARAQAFGCDANAILAAVAIAMAAIAAAEARRRAAEAAARRLASSSSSGSVRSYGGGHFGGGGAGRSF